MSTVADLLTHMRVHYSDGLIAHDLDAVLDAASSDDDRDVIRAYARLRRRAPGWNPRAYRAQRGARRMTL